MIVIISLLYISENVIFNNGVSFVQICGIAKYSKLNIYSEAELSMGGFAVPAGSLGFSVAVFCCCAITCFAILNFRRRTVGGELGGPKRLQNLSAIALVFLWFLYVLLSSLKAYEVI